MKVEIAFINLDGDAILWYDWFESSRGIPMWEEFVDGLMAQFGPAEFVRASSMVEVITSKQTRGGEAGTSEGKKDKTRVAISPIETRFTRVDMTVADSGERLDIGEHSMEHEVGDLKGRLGESRGNMLATVNSMLPYSGRSGDEGVAKFDVGECHGPPNGRGDDEGVTEIGGGECHSPPNERRF
ncbi:hypothetical protein Acr_11g0009590 [Actinidia rufa]|uniref:Retrotransposon gag domain-containing protein n=1 Tax=Actinidia rufa TaxID=165716 RepID=A0A7J0FDJ9_9ERIC|nr:hypothetical protein Acr_11g0009590 [Actinidia rufa]